jgi:hypothetical protein
MSNTAAGKEGWQQTYHHLRAIETEVGLPEGSIKPELNGRYSLVLMHLTEDQIRQMAHLWYVLSHTATVGDAQKRAAAQHKTST